MKQDEKSIQLFASWLPDEPMIGMLFCSVSRGSQIYSFEFADSWLSSHSDIILDPDLYNSRGRQFVPSDKKIFGFLSDCAPDRWGRTLLKRKEEILAKNENRAPVPLYEIDYLLGVNDETRMGGLRFKNAGENDFIATDSYLSVPPIESLRKLEQASLKFEKSEDPYEEKWLFMLLEPGSSLGGARPKATVKDTDGSLWVAKFPSKHDECDTGAWEATVNSLAKKCGLHCTETGIKKFTENGSTFLSKRFDRIQTGGKMHRLHYASAMTLLSKTDGANASDGTSYLDIADFIKSNSVHPKEDLRELWKRILFNVLVSNTDDHLRNHGFLLTERGWHLSPLFDVNPNPDGRFLSLNITENDNTKSVDLLLETAKYYGLKKDEAALESEKMQKIIAENWRQEAHRNEIPEKEIALTERAFKLS